MKPLLCEASVSWSISALQNLVVASSCDDLLVIRGSAAQQEQAGRMTANEFLELGLSRFSGSKSGADPIFLLLRHPT